MQRVLGKLNFVARHISKFSMIVKNLYPKNKNYDWNDVKEAAWCKLMEAIKVYHEFKIPSINEMLYCTHNYEDNGIRIETFFYVDNVIKDENKRLFDIYMRQLKGSEMSYNLIEKELLSLSEYLSKWKDYARMPCVITYNKVIQSIFSCDTCLEYSNRVQRLAASIIYSNAKIVHITGVKFKIVKITQHPVGKNEYLA
uniref:RT_RNaseH_2 domain-containing protein n=1 Tax=Strongyloides venezuelensis TaxID=75913 RepID=A0A0K0FHY4_STRVS